MTDPYSLPPGPQRRELLRHQGRTISITDFTDQENAETNAELAERARRRDRAAHAAVVKPPIP